MLIELKVSNFALIDDLSVKFHPGLNVLSGETGAGKSIVIGAINLLLGERAAVEQIREGEESSSIEGMIALNGELKTELAHMLTEAGIDMEEELIVAREIYRSGRSVARVNGRAVPAAFLKDLGRLLIDLHGQHKHQSLLMRERHLPLLDAFGGETIATALATIDKLYRRRQELKKELGALGEDSAERERRIDVNAFQLKEIRDAALVPHEDETLAEREKVLANAEKLCSLASKAYELIYAGGEEAGDEAVVDRLNRSLEMINEAAEIDARLSPPAEMLSSAAAQLVEASYELRDYRAGFEFDPAELAVVQERLNVVNTLKRKYGPTINEALVFAERIEAEIERLRNSEEVAEKIAAEVEAVEAQLRRESDLLRNLRRIAAAELERLLEESLKELALPNARFRVEIAGKEIFSPQGMDDIAFMFSANRGETVKPLVKIISGGEVSRVMLALKTILARQDRVPTLVFDEVDSGVGGATVQAVAEKLAQLAGNHQVLCVTHSPQIAAMADRHYRLFKENAGERTLTRADRLEERGRREELARMLDGAGIDRAGLEHVDNMMERARCFKTGLAE